MAKTTRKTPDITPQQREYIKAGWVIIELNCKSGRDQGKRPLQSNWQRTKYHEDVFKGAMAFGAIVPSDVLVIDVDPRHGGRESLEKLEADVGVKLSKLVTPIVKTGGRGVHIYLKIPPGVELRRKVTRYPGIDFLTHRAQVVGVGSYHFTGRRTYTWLDDDHKLGAGHADAPAPLLDALRRPTNTTTAAGLDEFDDSEQTCDDFRDLLHEALEEKNDVIGGRYVLACRGRDLGLSMEKCLELMSDEGCDPDNRLENKVRNAYTYGQNAPGARNPAAMFEDVSDEMPEPIEYLDIEGMLNTSAPERRYLFKDEDGSGVMPEGVGCGIAAPGGTGKSLIALQMAVALATGGTWLDRYRACGPTHVFLITCEDDAEELHRRLDAIIKHVTVFAAPSEVERLHLLLKKHLHIATFIGKEFALTQNLRTGYYASGPAVQHIIESIRSFDSSAVVIFDPLRKVAAGNEEGAAMNAVIKACDEIRVGIAGPITTVIVHHTSKESARQGDTSQSAFRGASDLVDGLRWTMTLSGLSEGDAKNLGIGDDDRLQLRKYAVPKTNYTSQISDRYLQYRDGLFVDTDLMPTREVAAQAEITVRLRELMNVILDLESNRTAISERKLREFAGVEKGPIHVAQRRLGQLLEAAMTQRLIDRHEGTVGRTQADLYRSTENGRSLVSGQL